MKSTPGLNLTILIVLFLVLCALPLPALSDCTSAASCIQAERDLKNLPQRPGSGAQSSGGDAYKQRVTQANDENAAGVAALNSGDYTAAVQYFRRAYAIWPDDVYQGNINLALSYVEYNQGAAAFRAGNYEQAAYYFQRADDIYRSRSYQLNIKQAGAAEVNERGRAAFRAKDFASAIQLFEEANNTFPDEGYEHNIGVAQSALKEQQAVDDLLKTANQSGGAQAVAGLDVISTDNNVDPHSSELQPGWQVTEDRAQVTHLEQRRDTLQQALDGVTKAYADQQGSGIEIAHLQHELLYDSVTDSLGVVATDTVLSNLPNPEDAPKVKLALEGTIAAINALAATDSNRSTQEDKLADAQAQAFSLLASTTLSAAGAANFKLLITYAFESAKLTLHNKSGSALVADCATSIVTLLGVANEPIGILNGGVHVVGDAFVAYRLKCDHDALDAGIVDSHRAILQMESRIRETDELIEFYKSQSEPQSK